MTQTATLTVHRLSDVAGAEIAEVDLSEPLSSALKDAILAAFLEHHLLVFRDQRLTQEPQHALTLHFGEIEGHVGRHPDGTPWPVVHLVHNLDEHGTPTETPDSIGNSASHTDTSCHAEPSLMTMLHALERPPHGGDTQYANAAAGYAALPEATTREIAALKAVHSWEASRRNLGVSPAMRRYRGDDPPVNAANRIRPRSRRVAPRLLTHLGEIARRRAAQHAALAVEARWSGRDRPSRSRGAPSCGRPSCPGAGAQPRRQRCQAARRLWSRRGSGSTPRPGPCGTAMRPFVPGWMASPSGLSPKSQ